MSRQRRSLPEITNTQLDKMFEDNPNYLHAVSKDKLPSAAKLDGKFIFINLQDQRAGPGT